MKKKIYVGIDLGTTYSAFGWYDPSTGRVEILKFDKEYLCTPSVISIENGKVLVGHEAKGMQAAGNVNTAAFYKSMMGEKDYTLYLDGKDYTPEELSGLFLREMKANIEEQYDVEIESAVITVPAYFDEVQRAATIKAGEAAGLKVLKIINEPTSAILAYGLTGGKEKCVMVYDLGGGTFDVSIARINGAEVDVIATNGNHQLGGKNWDSVLVDELVERFRSEHDINIADYPESYKELQVQAEEVKKALTMRSATTAKVTCEGYTGRYEITREFFDDRTESLLNETLLLIQKSFDEIGGGFGWQSLDEVVLVGGSTRMPQVKDMIAREYGKAPVTRNINVDTIVATGAAMQAELCVKGKLVIPTLGGGSQTATAGGSSGGLVVLAGDIHDSTAHSLGMLGMDKTETDYINSIIIVKNSKINTKFSRNYKLRGDTLDVYVLQGESTDPHDCALLYKYVVSGMPANKENRFAVKFLYNSSGMVEVEAEMEDGTVLAAVQMPITESIDKVIARLRLESENKRKIASEIEVLFMIDTSYSMNGTPLEKAKSAAKEFIRGLDLKRTKVSILDFADRSRWVCEYSDSQRTLFDAIDELKAGGPCGYANEETPLTTKGKGFKSNNAAKVIVVLTDGVWVDQASEIRSSSALRADGVTIYAVGFGGADKNFLDQIASEKGAKKIDLNNLSATFRDIASTIATEN